MHAFKCRADVAGGLDLNKGAEAGKGLELGGKDVEEGGGEDIHPLDVGRAGVNGGVRR